MLHEQGVRWRLISLLVTHQHHIIPLTQFSRLKLQTYLSTQHILSHWSLAASPDQEKTEDLSHDHYMTSRGGIFVVSITKIFRVTLITITMYPCHIAPPCSDMTLDATPPLHNCPPSVARKSRIIWWESESQWFRVRGGYNKNVSAARPGHFQH